MPEHKLLNFEEWTNEHCASLWKVSFAPAEGSLQSEDVHVVAESLEEARELARIWLEATQQAEDEPIVITKVEMLEWVCIR